MTQTALKSLEITHCNTDQTLLVQCIRTTNYALWDGVQDGQQSWCAVNLCTGPVVPATDPQYSIATVHFALPRSHGIPQCLGTWLIWMGGDANQILFKLMSNSGEDPLPLPESVLHLAQEHHWWPVPVTWCCWRQEMWLRIYVPGCWWFRTVLHALVVHADMGLGKFHFCWRRSALQPSCSPSQSHSQQNYYRKKPRNIR